MPRADTDPTHPVLGLPRNLVIGPDHAGNLLEINWLGLADDVNLHIHAVLLRPAFDDLLHRTGGEMP